jgi:RNA polymerase sigma-70 factor (ECF subfamily)
MINRHHKKEGWSVLLAAGQPTIHDSTNLEITSSNRAEMDRLITDYGVDHPAVMEGMAAEYSAPVYRLALSILCDPADAQDVMQSTFMQAAAAISRYTPGTNFKAWILKITVNNCRMLLRKRSALRVVQEAWHSLTRLSSPTPCIEAQVIENETRGELWRLVEALDEKHRLVVELRLGYGLTISEISQVLGIKEKTIYTRLYDAFARLRGQINLQDEGERDMERGRL